MFSILRPFLFNLDPETVHDLAIKSLKFNYLPAKMFEVEDEQMYSDQRQYQTRCAPQYYQYRRQQGGDYQII